VKDETGNGYYRIMIEQSQEEIVAKLEELKALIEKGDLKPWEFHGLKAIWFGRHLYEPLLYLDEKIVEISPVALMTSASSVPSANGTVTTGHDRNNNTTVDMKVQHLAHPSALTPSAIVYVVWVQANGHSAENQGELVVDDNLNGRFKGSTPYEQFSIFVTSEQSAQVRIPTGEQLLTAAVTQ
jgi:hypothetical protein